jgi:hypothetical protein
MRLITKILLQKRAGSNELPKEAVGHPVQATTQQLRRDIVPRLADFLDLLGKRQRQLVLGSDPIKLPLAQAQRHEVLGSIDLLG